MLLCNVGMPERCAPSSAAQVIDPVEDYLALMKKIFDFGAIRKLLARPDFAFAFDALNGVAGPYAKRIFVKARCFWHMSPDGVQSESRCHAR